MKISMLGTSGSGKTVYMSAMSELFFNASKNGYSIANRENSFESKSFVFKGFNDINTLYQTGNFPKITSQSVIMPLELRYNRERIIDIDWIDYRGGAINDLANGRIKDENVELLAALLASDVIMVFVDAAVLKLCKNDFYMRSRIGANEITQLLSLIMEKKNIDVMFLLTKIDSDKINIQRDFDFLLERLSKAYSLFLSEMNAKMSDFSVIPVGAVGYGNVTTIHRWNTDSEGNKTLIIEHKVKDFEKCNTVNIASSFAMSLLKCLESEIKETNVSAFRLANELYTLRENFGFVKNFIDILFYNSKKREVVYDLEHEIIRSREEIKSLLNYTEGLKKIISNKD